MTTVYLPDREYKLDFYPELEIEVSDITRKYYRLDCTINMLKQYDVDVLFQRCNNDNEYWYYGKLGEWNFTITLEYASFINTKNQVTIKFDLSNESLEDWLSENFLTKFKDEDFIEFAYSEVGDFINFMYDLEEFKIKCEVKLIDLLDDLEELYEVYLEVTKRMEMI